MILVTGATGYLGRHVVARLALRDAAVIAIGRHDLDLRQSYQTAVLVDMYEPDAIIHCAARVPKTPADYQDAEQAQESLRAFESISDRSTPIVFASSLTAEQQTSAYAQGKRDAEEMLARGVNMRLPGLFGLPRCSGVIYESARTGIIPESFGPFPAMHVADAAEYLVRAAIMPARARRQTLAVTYGDPRLEACYGSLGVTFHQRVHELTMAVRGEA